MRLRFDPDLPHQREALAAVLGLFEAEDDGPKPQPPSIAGVVANRLPLTPAALLANLQDTQRRAGLVVDETLPAETGIDVSVEMETGTGKTYTYVRTILELSRRHGLHKWLVIVPSVAIREGVLATLRDTREHFRSLMPEVVYRFWAYDGRPPRVRGFATADSLEIGVLTIDAFNKIGNRLRRSDDRFGGATPLSWVAATRPCLVLDEPHHYESTLSRASLGRLDPLVCLRYGATHRKRRGLVHRLTAAQAAEAGLVKRVEVATIEEPLDDSDDESDDESDDGLARMSAQIRRTIALHVARQAELAPRGIKVLSLLFVDRVAGYADPDGPVRALFDEHFDALKHGCPTLAALPAATARAAYFATKGGRGSLPVPTDAEAETQAARAAYQLILRDKTRLLSLDEPVSFVFSHSALREGWDNPNVFQICTLAPRGSAIRRRQEIGRGIRLCVDGNGQRVHDPAIDVLTVVPAEPYEDFVAAWQQELSLEDPDASPPVPRPTGETAPAPRPAPPLQDIAWIELDSERLVRDALQQLGERPAEAMPPEDPDAVRRRVDVLLARRRPPIILTAATILAVIAGACRRQPGPLARALAAAVCQQAGSS